MKLSKTTTALLLSISILALVPSISFAGEEQERAEIKTLNNSAVALMSINPNFALELVKIANAKAKELETSKNGENTKLAKEEEPDVQAHIKLFQESAAALTKTYPELAQQLTQMANEKIKTSGTNDKN